MILPVQSADELEAWLRKYRARSEEWKWRRCR
jgi:hypothetical protein